MFLGVIRVSAGYHDLPPSVYQMFTLLYPRIFRIYIGNPTRHLLGNNLQIPLKFDEIICFFYIFLFFFLAVLIPPTVRAPVEPHSVVFLRDVLTTGA